MGAGFGDVGFELAAMVVLAALTLLLASGLLRRVSEGPGARRREGHRPVPGV